MLWLLTGFIKRIMHWTNIFQIRNTFLQYILRIICEIFCNFHIKQSISKQWMRKVPQGVCHYKRRRKWEWMLISSSWDIFCFYISSRFLLMKTCITLLHRIVEYFELSTMQRLLFVFFHLCFVKPNNWIIITHTVEATNAINRTKYIRKQNINTTFLWK